MSTGTTFRIELGIDARRFIQQFQSNNADIEKLIQEGIELGIKELMEEQSIVRQVADNVKSEITSIASRAMLSYEARKKISEIVESKFHEKISAYAEAVAAQLEEAISKTQIKNSL